jgi:hypothetical protein
MKRCEFGPKPLPTRMRLGLKSLPGTNTLDYYKHSLRPKKIPNIGPWALYYKSFYGRKLRIFVISKSVCPWQTFPA